MGTHFNTYMYMHIMYTTNWFIHGEADTSAIYLFHTHIHVYIYIYTYTYVRQTDTNTVTSTCECASGQTGTIISLLTLLLCELVQ